MSKFNVKTRKEINELITKAIEQFDISCNNIKAFESITTESEVVKFLYLEEVSKRNFSIATILGTLKCLYDITPTDFLKEFDVHIKLTVNRFVLDILNRDFPEGIWVSSESNLRSNYMSEYKHLSELICGYGNYCSFKMESFKVFYPASIHRFVRGFAYGYSKTFQLLCKLYAVKYEATHPIEQDIWKNIRYFLLNDCYEYRLDGEYVFPYYDGEFNPTGNPKLASKYNHHMVNEKTYAKLQKKISNDKDREAFSYELFF